MLKILVKAFDGQSVQTVLYKGLYLWKMKLLLEKINSFKQLDLKMNE